MIWGREEWLRALADSSLHFSLTPSIQENRKRHLLSIANSSSFPFRMTVSRAGRGDDLRVSGSFALRSGARPWPPSR